LEGEWSRWNTGQTNKIWGETLNLAIYELCPKIWKDDLSKEWNQVIIIPLHKKEDKLNCNNYRGILLLNMTL